MTTIIETAGLTRRFGRQTAVDGLEMLVQAGDLLALVGPDGAGKTTTLRLLCGILAPTAGTVRVGGIDVVRQPDLARQRIGYAAQTFSLYPDLTVAENLAFFARVYGVAPTDEAARTRDLLAFSNLEHARGRLAGLLSGGMKQKLALACALIHEPDVLLLDEPATGVDPVSRRELWRILADLHARGKTIVLSTPYMDEAERCGRVALLDAGRLVALDSPLALEQALPLRFLSVQAPGLARGALLAALAEVEGAAGPAQSYGLAAHLPVHDPAQAEVSMRRALAAAGASEIEVRPVEPSLEDVFIARATPPHPPAPSPSRGEGERGGAAPSPAPSRGEDAPHPLPPAPSRSEGEYGGAAIRHPAPPNASVVLSAPSGADNTTDALPSLLRGRGGDHAHGEGEGEPAEPAIEVQDLSRHFGHFTAVDGVSFAVKRGEIFGFLGPNGSGKTTTIRMICGILAPSSGRARVLGHDVAEHPEDVRQITGYMSQRFGLYGDLTAAQNLEFYGGMYGVTGRAMRARRDELIAMAGLTGREKTLTAALSGGWRQRLALGCALVHRPAVLLLDEPTGGVDPASRRDFWDLIYRLAAGGTTILVTTHYMDEAEHCDRIALLHDSRLIATGSPAELKAGIRGTLLEVRAAPLDAALRALAGWNPALYGTALHLSIAGEDETRQIHEALRAAGLANSTVTPITPSLEDVFLALVSERKAMSAA